jgi:hypothetical protein
MASADISRFTSDPDLRRRLELLLTVLAGGPDYEKTAYTDADTLVDVVAFLAAMLVEEGPEFTTPRHLRLGVEEFERRALGFVKALREQRERTGKGAMETFMGDGGEARAIPIHNDC